MSATRHASYAVPAITAAVALCGCGSSGHVGGHLNFKNHSVPANATTLSVAVNNGEVLSSPAKIGGGQVILNVVNSSSHAQTVRVARASGTGTGRTTVVAKTPAIPAGGTAQVKAEITRGNYLIAAAPTAQALGSGIGIQHDRSGRLTVGLERNGNNAVDQP